MLLIPDYLIVNGLARLTPPSARHIHPHTTINCWQSHQRCPPLIRSGNHALMQWHTDALGADPGLGIFPKEASLHQSVQRTTVYPSWVAQTSPTQRPSSSEQCSVVSALRSMALKSIKADECAHPEHASHRIKVSTPPGHSISCCQLGTAVSSPALYSLAGCLSPDRHTYCMLNS